MSEILNLKIDLPMETALLVESNPWPVMFILVPPPLPPELGKTLVIVGVREAM